jgi:hypothetical protein
MVMLATIQFRTFSSCLLSKNIKIRIPKTIILPVVLYGCETWSLTLREERRLRAFDKKVLRRIFGPRRDEVTGGWRKLHNKELRYFVFFTKSRRMRRVGHSTNEGEEESQRERDH